MVVSRWWTRFLSWLRACWSGTKRAPLPTPPESDEPVVRFLTQSGHLAATTGRVKPAAFLPPRDLRTSVFRVRGLDLATMWEIGTRFVAQPRLVTIRGAGRVRVDHVRSVGLDVAPDEPPPRHANIVGWPAEKSERLSLAQQLAAGSALEIPAA